MASRNVTVNVIGDSRSLERTFARSSRASKAFGRDLTGNLGKADTALQRLGAGRAALLGGAAGAGVGLIAPKVIDQLMAAVDVASNLNEQVSKSRVVFGRSSAVIEDWAKTTADGLGIARDQAIEAASTFGSMFRQAGQAGGDAANLSKSVVQLAGDLASFNNTGVDEALTALRSGLSGEIEPLRRFQVFITEAAVQQRAMAQTGKDNAKQLTQGEKILARYSLIMEQTSRQQGDFQRTSKGLANQQRILAANVRDLQANLGELLVPTMTALTGFMVDATDATLKFVDALKKLGAVKIPTIHIPIVADMGGGTVGGAVGAAFGAIPTFFSNLPMNRLVLEIAKQIGNQFDDFTGGAVTGLANDFARSINTMTQNALDQAAGQVKAPRTPRLTPAIQFSQQPGVHGAFVDSIMGPIEKAIAIAKAQSATAITKGRAAISKQAAEKAREKQREGFDNLIAAIGLAVDQAAVSKGIADDLRRNTQLQNAIKAQIKVEGRTTELARQLFEARQARADILAGKAAAATEANQKLADALQAKQFKALGLTATGDEPVPGIKNLSKRINAALKNTDLGNIDISSKLISRLKAARKLIKTEGKSLTEETRRMINDFIKAATGQDAATKATGPLTKTSALNVNNILGGLGLTRDLEKELRSRLSGFNSAGLQLAGKTGTAATGGFVTPIIVQSHTTVTLDGDVVARAITRSQQKANRRNPPQRRGPNAR